MWTIDSPTTSPLELFDAVSAQRDPGTTAVFVAARSAVAQAYMNYDAARADVTALVPLGSPEPTFTALRSNYRRFREVSALYAALKLASKWCPMCGDRPVAALDHYLPNDKFPEF